jgi:hypothetical protein
MPSYVAWSRVSTAPDYAVPGTGPTPATMWSHAG